ncbi:hypothetical protein AB4Z46_08480 [Variovorax sp. M-6]
MHPIYRPVFDCVTGTRPVVSEVAHSAGIPASPGDTLVPGGSNWV